MKIKNLFLSIMAFSALAIGGCSQPGDPTSSPTSDPTSQPTSDPTSDPTSAPHVHSFESTWTDNEDYHWHRCTGCEEVSDKAAHSFVEKQTVPATCDSVELKIFECSVCGREKIDYTGHSLKAHEYQVKITKPATCSHEGDITIECIHCHEKTVEHFSDEKAHVFADPVEEDGISTYKCKECNYERRVINASDKLEHEVPTEDLRATGEIELQNAAIAFPESVLDQLGENVKISAEPKSVDDLENVSAENKELIKSGRVVDFSMKSDLEEVSQFDGQLEISIPYPLGEDEDPSGIVVWYLDEDGNPTPIEAEYRNGNAVFKTNHFSFYAVLNMSPEQLCEHFGHVDMTALTVPSTCVAHGYKDVTCRRCARALRTELPLTNHSYQFVEKKDSTVEEEGYIKYRCEVCGAEQITPIERKSEVEKGYYTNFLLSLGTSDLHVTGLAKMVNQLTGESMDSPVEIYYGYDENHLPFAYGDASGSLIGLYRGYTISSSYGMYEADETLMTALASFAELFDMLPGFVPEYIEKVGSFVVDKLFVKSEIPEGYEITINKQAVVQLVSDFTSKPLSEALVNLFGPEFVLKVTSFIANAYKASVNDVIVDLENRGIVLNELFNAVKSILKIVAPEIEQMLEPIDLDQILTDEVKAMPVLEFIKSMIPESAQSMIPETAEQAQALVGQLLSAKLLDLIGAPADMGPAIVSMVQAVLNSAKFSLKTEENGSFLSAELVLKDFGNIIGQRSIGDISFLVVKGFDKAPIIEKLDDLFAKAQKRKEVFKIGPDNLEFLEEFYDQQFPGVKFDYVEEYVYQEYGEYFYAPALVSKENVDYTVFDEEDWALKEETGKLVIILSRNSWINFVTNTKGYGTRLEKDETGLVLETYALFNAAYFTYEIEEEGGKVPVTYRMGEYTWKGEEGLLQGEFLYSFEKDEIYSTTGTFDYFSRDYETSIRLISAEEYEEYTGRSVDVQEGYKAVFYLTSQVGYSYASYFTVQDTNYYSSYDRILAYNVFLNGDMNDEALEHSDLFEFGIYYTNGTLETRPTEIYDFVRGSSSKYYNEATGEFVAGNAKFAVSITTGSKECTEVVKWTMFVNEKAVKSGTFNTHSLTDSKAEYIVTKISDCEDYVQEIMVCGCCGKKYYYGSWHSFHHDMHEVDHKEASLTEPGYVVYECEHCGHKEASITYPCPHFDYHYEYDEEGTIFVCDDCGYTIYSDTKPLMLIERVDTSDEALQYAYYFFTYTYEYQDKISDNYEFYLLVQHYNEETEQWEFVDEYTPYKLTRYKEYEEFEFLHGEIWCNFPHYYFDIPTEVLSSLQEQYPEEEGYRIVFAALYYGEMGTAFILSLD